jgi:cytoskeletal protein CcmA (bactofilin family)
VAQQRSKEAKEAPEGAPKRKPLDLELDTPVSGDVPDTFDDLEEAKRKSLFSKFNERFQDALQSSRGTDRTRDAVEEASEDPQVSADDLAMRRAKSVNTKRMVVPEGVIIQGSMTSGSETEIGGRIEGDVNVDGRLYLGTSALITGNVRAVYCKVEGLVDGKMECSQELELGKTGRINGDVLAGKSVQMAGQIFGNVSTPGLLHLTESAKLAGDIRARRLLIEEGASFNGSCIMRPPAQRNEA